MEELAWSDESRFLVYDIDGRVRIRRFRTETLVPGYTNGRRQACSVYNFLRAMFLWSTLGPIIPRRTISEEHTLPEYRCRPGAPIHVNNFSSGLIAFTNQIMRYVKQV